jgi:hypothetical protein
MNAQILYLEEKLRQLPISIASLNDFRYREGEAVDAQCILENPQLTLYCLDDERRRAIFVELPPEIDLASVPFVYQTQYQHALRLVAVPYETFHQLAQQVKVEKQQIIFLYSIGRCGSTLLSHAFNEAHGVRSLAEPDVYSQLVVMREADGSRDEEIEQLLRSCTALWCKSELATTSVFKFRSFCTELGDLLHRIFPDSKVLYLYRDVKDWAMSSARAFHLFELQKAGILDWPEFKRMFPMLVTRGVKSTGEMAAVESLALSWLSGMQGISRLQEHGVSVLALRYETMRDKPQEVISAIFDYCGISINNTEQLRQTFRKDSQEGTSLSQQQLQDKASLTREHLAHFQNVLRDYPELQWPTFLLERTLRV